MRAMLISLSLIVNLLMPITGMSAETSNRVVALVQDDVITLHELNNKIEEITGQTREEIRAGGEEYYTEVSDKVLDLMIDEMLAKNKIKELELEITESEIKDSIESIKRANNWTHEDLLNHLEQEGLSYEKLREKIKNELERRRLIDSEVQSKILIRDEEIEEYYNSHREEYLRQSEVEISGIFLFRQNTNDQSEEERLIEKGNSILKRLNNGEAFEDLAREFSQGPGANEGGNLGRFKESQIDADLSKVIENLAEGEVSGLIKRDNGLQIVKLVKRTEAGLVALEEVKENIFETLYNEEVNKRYTVWLNDLRSSFYIKKIF